MLPDVQVWYCSRACRMRREMTKVFFGFLALGAKKKKGRSRADEWSSFLCSVKCLLLLTTQQVSSIMPFDDHIVSIMPVALLYSRPQAVGTDVDWTFLPPPTDTLPMTLDNNSAEDILSSSLCSLSSPWSSWSKRPFWWLVVRFLSLETVVLSLLFFLRNDGWFCTGWLMLSR